VLDTDEAIAVVGLSVRLPGIADIDRFWLSLVAGRGPVPPAQPPAADTGLDPGLFGLTASEVDGWDRRTRLLLAAVHAAVESAGYDPGRLPAAVGVFAAADDLDGPGVDRLRFAATAAAYALDLRGPSLTVGSGALAALHLAGQSLRAGDCDAALAGGVSAGGAGAVLLKRLPDALADHDHVSAVIRGTVVNCDGGHGRVDAVAEALATDPAYVEVDGRDVAALVAAAGPRPCGVGSVAAGLGPLGTVAGLAGFVKTVLALEREQLPASAPVPMPDDGPLRRVDRLAPWPRDPGRPRRAAVVSFGVGGSDAHAVVEEAPSWRYTPHVEQPRVVAWSARTAAAEKAVRHRLATFFVERGEEVFADAVATLQYGRAAHSARAAAVCTGALDAAAVLGAIDCARVVTAAAAEPVVLRFPGQGSPYAARELYAGVPAFARIFDGWLDRLDGPDRRGRDRWLAAGDPDDPVLLFAVEAALGQFWLEAGVRPAAVTGDGVGALAAAAVAEVLVPADAAELVPAVVRGTDLEDALAGVATKPPSIPVRSAVTGREITPEQAGQPDFWARELTAPAPAADAAVPVAPAGTRALLETAARLWTAGHDIAWEVVGQEPLRHRVALPPYPADAEVRVPIWPLTAALRGGTARSGPAANLFDVLTVGPGPLVVAFPYAGASGRAFQRVRRYLPEGCGLALVDLPGHGRRMGEPCLRDVDAVIAELLDALPALPDRRLVLLGYSLGGSFAFELAGRLVSAGTPVEGVVVCGTRAPQTGVGHPPVAHRPAGEPFLRAAVEIGVAAPEMLELPDLTDAFAGPLQADLSIVESFPHHPRRPPLQVPVCVIGLRSDPLVPEPSLRAWDDVCAHPPRHLRVDGGHLAIHEREREFGEAVGCAVAHVLGARVPLR
jgi:acyl transferase domain-containing protein/surfactin synthase thioesterase subunit